MKIFLFVREFDYEGYGEPDYWFKTKRQARRVVDRFNKRNSSRTSRAVVLEVEQYKPKKGSK